MSPEQEWFPCPCCDGNGGTTWGPLPDHAALVAERDRLREALQEIADYSDEPASKNIARAALEQPE